MILLDSTDSRPILVERKNKKVYDLGSSIVKAFNATKPVSDVFNEALNLARINECGIRSPRVLEVAEVDIDDERCWALRTSKVPGSTMAYRMRTEPARYYEYLERFVDLQIEIHAFRSPLLGRQRDKLTRMIRELDRLTPTVRYGLMERLDGMKQEFQVCHGDFNPTNVIVEPDGSLAVCDWPHATQGSPAADAATTYLLFALDDREQAEAYLEAYCERSGTAPQIVRQWMPVVAASELARRRGSGNDGLLMSWIEIADVQ